MNIRSGLLSSLALLLTTPVSASADTAAQDHFEVRGLKAKAEVLVDRWGVSHIYAASPADAFFVQGWNAARDRLFQIDLWRRGGIGELSAVLGEKYVAKDRAARLFSYRGDMRKEWAAYGADGERNVRAFVAGINAYVAAAKADAKLMPPEFALAGYEPALWKAEDVVRVRNHAIVLSATLQPGRAEMACKDGSDTTPFLPTISPPWKPRVPEGLDLCSIPANVLEQYFLARAPVTFPAKPTGATTALEHERLQAAESPPTINRGSNNWVIAPSKSATGRPILASDPHLPVSTPSPFYISHLSAPGIDFIGAGDPALPGVLLGHNGNIAIGMTLFVIAQEDIYVYETNPENPNQYRYQDKWESMRVARESVAVRGAGKRDVELKFTRHGPVLLEDTAKHRAYAVRAAWLDTGAAPYLGSMRYLQARTVDDVASALKHWGTPGVNAVVADTAGKIGWFPSGFVPIRPNSDGLLPLPGNGRYEWQGYWDRDLLPSEVDPGRGYIATANQLNLPKNFPYAQRPVSFFWIDSSRFDRITEVLDGKAKVSLEDSERLQHEFVTVPGRRLVGLLAKLKPSDPEQAELIQWLSSWDASVTAQSSQAALYEVWLARHLVPAVIAKTAPSMPPGYMRVVTSKLNVAAMIDLLERPDQKLGADPQRARDELMLSTLTSALAETKKLLGPDRASWQWGKLSTILLKHPLSPLADAAQRAKMDVGPAPKSGDSHVVAVSEYNDANFRTTAAASFRIVLDVGEWDNSLALNAPGQSGDWTSPHYQDLFPSWLAGNYFPLLYTRPAIEKATQRKISLAPESR
jgi:penicillin G amidase